MKALESIKDLSRHINSSRLHFGHRWSTHFGCVSGFSRLCHAFFGRGFISRCGAYQWSSFPRRCPCCFGHFIFICNSSTFWSHMDSTSFFLLVFSAKFWQENYVSMWGHYGSKIVIIFLGPLNETSSLIIDILWWYKPSILWRIVPHLLFLGVRFKWFHICALVFVFLIDLFWRNMSFKLKGGPHLLQSCLCVMWNDLF